MNNKTLFLSVVTSALLAACGGGGGDKTPTVTNPSSNSGTQTTTPSNTFTVKAQYKDACGNATPAPAASLIVHDAEFNTEQVVNADANGVISFTSTSATKSVSLLIPGQKALDNGITPLQIETYVDQPVSDMGEYSIYNYDFSECECKDISEIKVTAPLRANTRPDYVSLSGDTDLGLITRSETTVFVDAKVCQQEDGQWPMLSATLGYFNPNEVFATIFSDLDSDTITKEAELSGKPVSVSTQTQNYVQIYAKSDGYTHFSNFTPYPQEPVFAFESPEIDFYNLSAYNHAQLPITSGIKKASMMNSIDHKVATVDSSYTLETVDMEPQELLSILDDSVATYDLTSNESLDLVNITTRATSGFTELLFWSIRAPTSGSIPSLENIDISNFITNEQLQEHTSNIKVRISAFDYQGINSYEDYNAKIIDRKTAADELKPEWQHFTRSTVTIDADSSFISASGQRPGLAIKLLGTQIK